MSNYNTRQRINRSTVCPVIAKEEVMTSHNNFNEDEYKADFQRGDQGYAVKNYSDQRNSMSLLFVEGDIITILEKFHDGMCKGYISRLGPNSKIGIFPITCVVPFTKNNKYSSNIAKSTDLRKVNPSPTNLVLNQTIENCHMYSCNSVEIRKFLNTDTKINQPSEDVINRGSTYSVDSGRGSSTVNILQNNNKMNSASTFDQTQHIQETYSSQSIESGLASYQRQSSSSNSSVGADSNIDSNSKHSTEQRQIIAPKEGDEDTIKGWLRTMDLEIYSPNFINSGYDFQTLLRMTPEDLNAVGITNPRHRKLIKQDISNRLAAIKDKQFEPIPATVRDWLTLLNLQQYLEIIVQQGYESMEKIMQLTWEDLEDVGIKKLGHQKKLLLAVEKLKKQFKNPQPEKLPISYSAENFRDKNIRFLISNTSAPFKLNHESYFINPSFLNFPKPHSSSPSPPTRKTSQKSSSCLTFSNHQGWPNSVDSTIPPPTPKRISSTISNPKPSNQTSIFRKTYENIDESFELAFKSSQDNRADKDSSGTNFESNRAFQINSLQNTTVKMRGSTTKISESNCLPFANENCGTVKQRSCSLDRTDLWRDGMDFGILRLKSNILSGAKSVLPLNLPYNVDSLSHKATSSRQKIKVNISHERNIQMIPSDVHVAAGKKVQLPKLHVEDNSSDEDFTDICDMLEDLAGLINKESARNQ